MPPAKQHAIRMKEASFADFAFVGPAGRAVSRGPLHLPRALDGHGDGNDKRGHSTSSRDKAASYEYAVRVGIECEPPPKEDRRQVDRASEMGCVTVS